MNLFHQVDWCSITIFVLGLVHVILPMKTINEWLFSVESQDEVVVYEDAEVEFETVILLCFSLFKFEFLGLR